jgi:RAB protein geranylgeranyltransferase component A
MIFNRLLLGLLTQQLDKKMLKFIQSYNKKYEGIYQIWYSRDASSFFFIVMKTMDKYKSTELYFNYDNLILFLETIPEYKIQLREEQIKNILE